MSKFKKIAGDQIQRVVFKHDLIKVMKNETGQEIYVRLRDLVSFLEGNENIDWVFLDEDGNDVTAPNLASRTTTVVVYKNGHVWRYSPSSGWVYQGQITTGGSGSDTDFIFYASDNDGTTPPVAPPTVTTLAAFQNGWLWEWQSSWVVLGKLNIPTAFLALTDTPSSYSGQAGNVPTVNSGETELVFLPRGDNWTWGTTPTAPSNTIGNDGDEFVTSAGRIYEKVAGAWVLKDQRLVTSGDYPAPHTTSGIDVVVRGSTGTVGVIAIGDFSSYINKHVTHSGTTGTINLSARAGHIPIVYMNYTGASTLRMANGVNGNDSLVVVIKNINTGTVTVERATTDTTSTINGGTTYSVLPNEYVVFQYVHASTDWKVLSKSNPASLPVETFIELTDTPATYTANAIPSANAAGDALIWSILGQDTTTSANLERIIIKAPSGAGVREVFTIFPNGQTANKGFIIRDFGSGTQRLEVLVQRVAAISGNLTLWGANATSDYVEIIRMFLNPNAFSLTAERPFIRSLRPGYTGASTVLFYGEEEEVILTAAAALQGATAISVSMLSAKTWRASPFDNPTSGSTHVLNLGDTIFYKEKSFNGQNSSGVIIIVKGTRHVVDEPRNYIDRESVIVNEIDKQAGMSEFGFYAHKSNGGIFKQPLPTFADNDAAIAGGLTIDMWYKTAAGDVKIVV